MKYEIITAKCRSEHVMDFTIKNEANKYNHPCMNLEKNDIVKALKREIEYAYYFDEDDADIANCQELIASAPIQEAVKKHIETLENTIKLLKRNFNL
jgi:hypothetical protein